MVQAKVQVEKASQKATIRI